MHAREPRERQTEQSLNDLRRRLNPQTDEELEVLRALAYACTLQSPRRFGAEEMTSAKWRRLCGSIDSESLAAVARGVRAHADGARNRLWYILGALAREYTALVTLGGRNRSKNFDERRYSSADFERVITRIESLSEADL